MRNSLRHILSALRFSRLTVAFLVLQTVLACAFLSNALFFIAQQAAPMLVPTGIAKGQVLFADHIYLPVKPNPETHKITGGTTRADLQTLEDRVRAIQGVEAVSVGDGLPYTSGYSGGLEFRNGKTGPTVKASVYLGDHPVAAMGLRLVAGRRFSRGDIGNIALGDPYSFQPHAAIISQSLADRLFPGGHALGRRIETVGSMAGINPVVIGVVRNLPARQPVDMAHANDAVLLPLVPTTFPMVMLTVLTKPAARADVARRLPKVIMQSLHLSKTSSQPRVRAFEAARAAYFRPNRSLIWLMLGVTLAVVAITVIGIMGLTGFWVQRRTRSIGIRRALGATRGDILRYFMVENFMVVGTGVALGVLVAWGGNLWLMSHLAFQRLPLWYLLIGAVVLWILGQLAVLAPALRAAAVPPVVATRSV